MMKAEYIPGYGHRLTTKEGDLIPLSTLRATVWGLDGSLGACLWAVQKQTKRFMPLKTWQSSDTDFSLLPTLKGWVETYQPRGFEVNRGRDPAKYATSHAVFSRIRGANLEWVSDGQSPGKLVNDVTVEGAKLALYDLFSAQAVNTDCFEPSWELLAAKLKNADDSGVQAFLLSCCSALKLIKPGSISYGEARAFW